MSYYLEVYRPPIILILDGTKSYKLFIPPEHIKLPKNPPLVKPLDSEIAAICHQWKYHLLT